MMASDGGGGKREKTLKFQKKNFTFFCCIFFLCVGKKAFDKAEEKTFILGLSTAPFWFS